MNGKISIHGKSVKAYSIPELLVVMIITGIIILSVANGVTMLRRYMANTASHILSSTDSIIEYYKNHTYTIFNGKVLDSDSMRNIIQDSLFADFMNKEIVYTQQLKNKRTNIYVSVGQ